MACKTTVATAAPHSPQNPPPAAPSGPTAQEGTVSHVATQSNVLQHSCNTALQHCVATLRCNMLQHSAIGCNAQRSA